MCPSFEKVPSASAIRRDMNAIETSYWNETSYDDMDRVAIGVGCMRWRKTSNFKLWPISCFADQKPICEFDCASQGQSL